MLLLLLSWRLCFGAMFVERFSYIIPIVKIPHQNFVLVYRFEIGLSDLLHVALCVCYFLVEKVLYLQ